MPTEEQILQNRQKLAERFGTINRTGGSNSQRIVKKQSTKTSSDDKNISNVIQKLQAQPLPDIQEVCLYTNDDEVITIYNPQANASLANKTVIFKGKTTKKPISDSLAEHMKHLPPAQLQRIKNPTSSTQKQTQDSKEKNIQDFNNIDQN